MGGLLKGNYGLVRGRTAKKKGKRPAVETVTEEFQRRALEHLGGSIAFVIKKDAFVWDGEEPSRRKSRGGKK